MIKLAADSMAGSGGPRNIRGVYNNAAIRMSRWGAAFRNGKEIAAAVLAAREELAELQGGTEATAGAKTSAAPFEDLCWFFRLRDMLITQIVYLGAMEDYIRRGGGSRGSALYSDPSGEKPYPQLPDTFSFKLDDGGTGRMIQEVNWNNGNCSYSWRPVRPIPEDDDFFENVWRSYRDNGNIY
jgi:hypothetical protein